MHLQLSDAATDTGTDPVAKWNGAEGVVGGAVAPEPALGQEPLRLGEVGLIVGHRVVCQDEEGLWGKKRGGGSGGGGINDPHQAPLSTAGVPTAWPPLTFLGKR